jgi:hypothetical protein
MKLGKFKVQSSKQGGYSMKGLTAESVIEAIEGGAHSLSAVYHAHGGKGNVSGSTTKKIRGLVPDVADRIAAAKAAKAYDEGKTSQAFQVEVGKVEKPKASDKAAALEGSKLFRDGSLIGIVFGVGHGKTPRLLSEVIDEAAKTPEFTKLTTKDGHKLGIQDRRRRARWQYTMIASLAHPTNKGRVRSVETDLEGKPRGDRKLKDNQKLVVFETVQA